MPPPCINLIQYQNTNLTQQQKQQSQNKIVKMGFYEVVSTIGKGNYAVVKLARHRVVKTEVCYLFCINSIN